MLAFGLGTLPNLLLMGVFADGLRRWMQQRPVRLVAGLGVAGLGAYRLIQLLI
jgi:sulfite exporter TauE/SafE